MKNKCAVLIPALDPPNEFPDYIKKLISVGFDTLIIIDDGSRKKKLFKEISLYPQVTVLTHEKNFGKGRALRTGLRYYKDHFLSKGYIGVITVDSDGQHLVNDVCKIRNYMSSDNQSLVLGARDFNLEHVPPKSRIGNKLTSLTFRLFIGLSISDTQTGLRGIPNSLIEECLSIPGDRFEYETDMLIQIGKKHEIHEIKIHTIYFCQNQGTHFHPIRDSFLIYRLLFGTFFRYLFVSFSSFLLDIILFALGTKILFYGINARIPLSVLYARIISGTYNFLLNKNIVFKSNRSYTFTGISYIILCIVQGILTAGLVTQLCVFFSIEEVVIKIIVDILFFLINYQIQKKLIF